MSEQLVKALEYIETCARHRLAELGSKQRFAASPLEIAAGALSYIQNEAQAALAAHRAAQAEPARRPYCCERCEREAQVADQAERDDTCPGCRGSGLASQWAQDQDGHEIELADSCDQCRGTGKVPVQGERDDEASSEDFDAAMLRTLLAQQREEAIALLQSIEHERDKAERLLERLVDADEARQLCLCEPHESAPFCQHDGLYYSIQEEVEQHVAARRAARGEA